MDKPPAGLLQVSGISSPKNFKLLDEDLPANFTEVFGVGESGPCCMD
jgi:hypothetical protein